MGDHFPGCPSPVEPCTCCPGCLLARQYRPVADLVAEYRATAATATDTALATGQNVGWPS